MLSRRGYGKRAIRKFWNLQSPSKFSASQNGKISGTFSSPDEHTITDYLFDMTRDVWICHYRYDIVHFASFGGEENIANDPCFVKLFLLLQLRVGAQSMQLS